MIAASQSSDRTGWHVESRAGRLEWISLTAGGFWIIVLQVIDWPIVLYPTDASSARVDSAVFAYAGELIRNAGVPYISYWDHKPPLIHFINAAGLILAGGNLWGVWLVSLSALLGAMLLGWHVLRRTLGTPAAVLGIGFFVLSLSSVLASNHTEMYVLIFQWASVLVFIRASTFEHGTFAAGAWLGILGTLECLLRPNLIGSAVSIVLVLSLLMLADKKWASWGRFVAGGICGTLLIASALVVYLSWHGALSAFWEQVYRYNVVYSDVTWNLRIRAMYFGLKTAIQYGTVLPLAGWLLALYFIMTRGRSHPLYGLWFLSAVWLPVELLSASASGRTYANYYMPLLAPLALLTSLLAAELLSRLQPSQEWRPAGLAVVVLLAMAILPVSDTALKVRDRGLRLSRMEQIPLTAHYIRQHTNPHATILVWGHAADLYLLSGRQPASRFIYPLALLTPGYADARLVQSFLDEVEAAGPVFIIDASQTGTNVRGGEAAVPSLAQWQPDWLNPDPRDPVVASLGLRATWAMTPALKAFYDYVKANYLLVDRVGPQRWEIYRRSGIDHG